MPPDLRFYSDEEEYAQLPPLETHYLQGGRRRHCNFDIQDTAFYHSNKENQRFDQHSDIIGDKKK